MCEPFGKPHVLFSVWIPGVCLHFFIHFTVIITSTLECAVIHHKIVFDILVLSLTAYNAFSRPRDYRTKLTRAMHRDGIMYFLVRVPLHFPRVFAHHPALAPLWYVCLFQSEYEDSKR